MIVIMIMPQVLLLSRTHLNRI